MALSFVVGYQTKTTVAGFNFVTPTFKNVGASAMSIQGIKLSGDNAMEYIDTLQILDEGGAVNEGFFWTADGWVTELGEPAKTPIRPGEGVLVSTMLDGVIVTFAGEVSSEDIKLISIAGFNFVGNATPIDTTVQSITLSGDNAMEYIDTLQILDDGGAVKEGFFWTADGWVTELGEPAEAILNAGDGVLISTMMEGVEINIPSAL